MENYRDEDSREGFSKIEKVFHDITYEIRNIRLDGQAKKKPKKRKWK
jgi:hypothetical protein